MLYSFLFVIEDAIGFLWHLHVHMPNFLWNLLCQHFQSCLWYCFLKYYSIAFSILPGIAGGLALELSEDQLDTLPNSIFHAKLAASFIIVLSIIPLRNITIWFSDTARAWRQSSGFFFGGTIDKTLFEYLKNKKACDMQWSQRKIWRILN